MGRNLKILKNEYNIVKKYFLLLHRTSKHTKWRKAKHIRKLIGSATS